jgi:hypothetical protein
MSSIAFSEPTIGTAFPNIRLHVLFTILHAEMAVGRKEELDILLCSREDRGEF